AIPLGRRRSHGDDAQLVILGHRLARHRQRMPEVEQLPTGPTIGTSERCDRRRDDRDDQGCDEGTELHQGSLRAGFPLKHAAPYATSDIIAIPATLTATCEPIESSKYATTISAVSERNVPKQNIW